MSNVQWKIDKHVIKCLYKVYNTYEADVPLRNYSLTHSLMKHIAQNIPRQSACAAFEVSSWTNKKKDQCSVSVIISYQSSGVCLILFTGWEYIHYRLSLPSMPRPLSCTRRRPCTWRTGLPTVPICSLLLWQSCSVHDPRLFIRWIMIRLIA